MVNSIHYGFACIMKYLHITVLRMSEFKDIFLRSENGCLILIKAINRPMTF